MVKYLEFGALIEASSIHGEVIIITIIDISDAGTRFLGEYEFDGISVLCITCLLTIDVV